MKDKYDKAIEYLSEHPEEIEEAWDQLTHRAHDLFRYVAKDELWTRKDGKPCGCLTQVRVGEHLAYTDALTREIRNDERIPMYPHDIALEHLPVFAEWQRRLDRELGRS